MSKRGAKMTTETCTKPKQARHWSLGLLESMKDPQSIVMETENIVVIKDKYPKAKKHFLLLPNDNISSIYNLNSSHINLFEEFGKLYGDLKNEHQGIKLRAGFHAVPSMQRLHMHVISTDMISPCLKTKIHWNSFTTPFFLSYEDVYKELKYKGSIERMSSEKHKILMATPLQCNQCKFKPKNMPDLKEHLLSHNK